MLVSLALAALLAGHPSSLSHTRIRVEGAHVRVEIGFEALSLIEALPELERVADGFLDAEERDQGRAAIARYLLADFRLVALEGPHAEPLVGELSTLEGEDPARLGPLELQTLEAVLVYEAPHALEVLEVESRLFRETNPWHKDFTTLAWNDDAPVPHLFSGERARWRFEPAHVRRPGVFALFLRLGVEHIAGGYDHQAFLLALLVASRRARALIGVVTAFTLAHSITLALAALDVVHVPPRFVELAIALSIAYVACDNLLRKEPHAPWLEAFLFGLLHGLGFAGYLSEAMSGEPLIVTALFAFNLGVELGQLALVLACLLLIALAFRGWRARTPAEERGLVPRPVRLGISALVALAGFAWFGQRAGWLG